jgi:hypothetical protein
VALCCKPLQQAADQHVEELKCHEELLPGAYSVLQRRWPHALHAVVSRMEQATAILELRPLARITLLEPAGTVDLRPLDAFPELRRVEVDNCDDYVTLLAALPQLEVLLHILYSGMGIPNLQALRAARG